MATQTPPLQPGDLCITGTNRYPRFRVIAVHEDRAWVRDVETGADAVVGVTHCHPVDGVVTGADARPPRVADRDAGGAPMPAGVAWPDGSPRP